MSYQDNQPSQYSELRSIHKCYIDLYNVLYQLKTEKEDELNSIYKLIKTELIDSKICHPQNIMRDILNIIPYHNRYTKSYLYLVKLISDDYHINEVYNVEHISSILFYKEYGIKLNETQDFENTKSDNLDIQSENTIYGAIMNNDLKRFISFTEKEGFNKDQTLKDYYYEYSKKGYLLLELCCYHGAVDCFKLLRTKFNSEITEKCLEFSFLGGNPEIMSECLKYQKQNNE
ncbi:hypothetical protein TVAG_445980 [Trichomonas vaginalis G3]|uniref:DUF3447 domain-containing protein n=1 Tax=Trichomonas vaginalis (strain ATCC PRA-98 / G3) TaxID=412133 RepID=A2FXQ7_TRIV3|nr:protein of unknown function (DUF3447) [Trichomonas vaginalis G3]EAX90298.1 hypothetical protein TVAG_445980 [Trichomonas vaginalis G3]KAI5491150.1 protein of unknown function (DUF3447) [Trichomonas vaginalis G3]|eukprot:XP_001303228.1 hypothetical protein [Trichomonas vaginalis G3]